MQFNKAIRAKFRLSLSRSSSGDWNLEIVDDDATLHVARITLTPEEFSKLLASSAPTVEGDYWISERHGKIHECVTVGVEVSRDAIEDIELVNSKAQSAAADVIGHLDDAPWVPERVKSWNFHRATNLSNGRYIYSVTYRRWLPRGE